jgi:hypothetical protein
VKGSPKRAAAKVVVRGVLWVVKGALLVFAVGAIWMWAGNRQGPRNFRITHWTVGPDRISGFGVSGGWGRAYPTSLVGVGWFCESYPEGWKATWPKTNGRHYANRDGVGWEWGFAEPEYRNWNFYTSGRAWGWFTVGSANPGYYIACDYRTFAWIGGAAAVWPVASVVRWVFRRRRVRGWAVAGCCWGCGYDMRATPERCPECGMRAEGV